MLRCPSAIVELSESFRQDDRVRIDHTGRTRIRRPCHNGLWRSGKSVQELDAHQQGEVLVHRVVAVVDIGPAVFAELDLERDLSGRTQPPHVLADKTLRCRDGVAAAIDRNAFIECGSPLSTMTVHGNPFSVAQSGIHVPVPGWIESPLPDLPHWTTR